MKKALKMIGVMVSTIVVDAMALYHAYCWVQTGLRNVRADGYQKGCGDGYDVGYKWGKSAALSVALSEGCIDWRQFDELKEKLKKC